MRENDLLFSFLLATIALVLQTALFPNLPIYPYLPFLVILILQASYLTTLWVAAFCGLIIDLLSTTPFGFYALSYSLAAFLLYRQKKFFNDKPFNISLFTYLSSILFSLITFILLQFVQKQLLFSFQWVIRDLLIMPILDLFYALVFFVIPINLMRSLKKKLFLIKRKARR